MTKQANIGVKGSAPDAKEGDHICLKLPSTEGGSLSIV